MEERARMMEEGDGNPEEQVRKKRRKKAREGKVASLDQRKW